MNENDRVVRKFLADPEKRGALYGTLLGDATLTHISPGKYKSCRASKHGPNGTTYVRIKHAESQKALVEHKHKFMHEVSGNIFAAKPKNHKWQTAYGFYTKNSTEWLDVYNRLYANSREVVNKSGRIQRFKCLTSDVLDELDNRGLAWWIMDDGCFSRCKCGFFRLSTQAFTLEEHELIIGWLKNKYNVKASTNRCARVGKNPLATYDSYVLYIGERELQKLIPYVEPHIIPELRYKLGLEPVEDKSCLVLA